MNLGQSTEVENYLAWGRVLAQFNQNPTPVVPGQVSLPELAITKEKIPPKIWNDAKPDFGKFAMLAPLVFKQKGADKLLAPLYWLVAIDSEGRIEYLVDVPYVPTTLLDPLAPQMPYLGRFAKYEELLRDKVAPKTADEVYDFLTKLGEEDIRLRASQAGYIPEDEAILFPITLEPVSFRIPEGDYSAPIVFGNSKRRRALTDAMTMASSAILTDSSASWPDLVRMILQALWANDIIENRPYSSVLIKGMQADFLADMADAHRMSREQMSSALSTFQLEQQQLTELLSILQATSERLEAKYPDGFYQSWALAKAEDEQISSEIDRIAAAKSFWDRWHHGRGFLARMFSKRPSEEWLKEFVSQLPEGDWNTNTIPEQMAQASQKHLGQRAKLQKRLLPLQDDYSQLKTKIRDLQTFLQKVVGTTYPMTTELSRDVFRAIEEWFIGKYEESIQDSLQSLLADATLTLGANPKADGLCFGENPKVCIVLNAEKQAPFTQTASRMYAIAKSERIDSPAVAPEFDAALSAALGFSSENGDLDELEDLGVTLAAGSVARMLPNVLLTENMRSAFTPLSFKKGEDVRGEINCEIVKGYSQRYGGSLRNYQEAQAIAQWLKEHHAELAAEGSILVTTPYMAQAQTLESLIPAELARVQVLTEAKSADTVLFSWVHSPSDPRPFAMDESLGPINLALSLAEKSFWIFGDLTSLSPAQHSPSGLLARRLKIDVAQKKVVQTGSEQVEA